MGRRVLVIETSTKRCSVAAFDGEALVATEAARGAGFVHAEQLMPLVDAVVRAAGWTPGELEAVAVSAGPGSYTGLRIGVATAKGLCHALGVPLLALDTLELLGRGAASEVAAAGADVAVWPVVDARRLEVYVRPFRVQEGAWSAEGAAAAVDLTEAVPAGSGLEAPALVVVGDAAEKVAGVGLRADAVCVQREPDAAAAGPMLAGAEAVDLAYFEPRYLKEFQAGAPKDPLGLRAAAIDRQEHA